MTPQQVDLVEASLATVGPHLDDIVRAFYDRLFELDPTTRPLFAEDLTTQRVKFGHELAYIVTSIRHHDRFVDETDVLGRHHADLGVRPEHFRTAGRAVLDAFADVLGDAWTLELADAWRLAYRLTAEAMLTGASRRP
ncbi:MAG: globin domain-containing protein [Ilumatobacteraceae bacterium]